MAGSSIRINKHRLRKGVLERHCLGGGAEAQDFIDGDFRKLHQSTLRKVDSFESMIDKAFGE